LPLDSSGISCCFDETSQRILDNYRKKGLGETSDAIIRGLNGRGLEGSTVLELGCGVGALMLELLRKGAASAAGVDLSPKMIQLARALAGEAGLSGSASFEVGDAAVMELKKSDFVILDTVLCCYPDVTALVTNSSSAAKKFYAFSVPDDNRLATRILKPLLPLQRVLFRRTGGFRFFIHPTRHISETLKAKGFRQVSRSPAGWIWSAFLFAAPGVP
jgi:magnesium-protoporphyrin O-methyltransferase